jgi:hypothetical protein
MVLLELSRAGTASALASALRPGDGQRDEYRVVTGEIVTPSA